MGLWTKLTSQILNAAPWRKGDAAGLSRAKKEPKFERAVVRKPQRMKEGYLWAEGMINPRPCTIRDMSLIGAQVDIWQDDIKPALLRGTLKLYSCADQKEVECTVAGRKGDALGLRFTGTFRPPSRRYS